MALWLGGFLLLPALGFAAVTISGVNEAGIVKELREVSQLTDSDTRLQSEFLMRSYARNDIQAFLDILHSHGYFDAEIDVVVSESSDTGLLADYQILPGDRYTLDDIEIRSESPDSEQALKSLTGSAVNLESGQAVEADAIRKAANTLRHRVRERGYPFVEVGDPEVHLSPQSSTARILFRVRPGPRVRYGNLSIEGLETVDASVIRDKIRWETGDHYDPEQVLRLKRKLMETDLFSRVQVVLETPSDGTPSAPVRINVAEAEQRLITLGLGYDSDIGPKAAGAWEHLNIFGSGEQLRLQTSVSQEELETAAELRLPHIPGEKQSTRFNATLRKEDRNSYESTSYETAVHIDWQNSNILRTGGGIKYAYSEVDGPTGDGAFHLLSLPLLGEWDNRDDLLNPSQGGRLLLEFEPFAELSAEGLFFQKAAISARHFFQALPGLVLAGRTKLGTILGEDLTAIPADERYYSGGGGSIRGYPYQEVGPRYKGEILGGRSLLELSGELRWRWNPKIGWVLFVDGGNAYRDSLPDFAEIYWGAGLGFRYHTPLGPLRVDVAVPLNKEDPIEEDVQFYISLGQAF